ncbi:hypothetical protein D3C71_1034140 [compost metagenome]
MLNIASLTLSVVGRVPVPGTLFSGLPFAVPDTTLTACFTCSVSLYLITSITTAFHAYSTTSEP